MLAVGEPSVGEPADGEQADGEPANCEPVDGGLMIDTRKSKSVAFPRK
jgi:hypothetical protein